MAKRAAKAAGKASGKTATEPAREASTTAVRTATVVLSGGAPNSPLMAGALAAIYEAKKTFNIFYTSGAGAGIGLLFVAPKDKTPPEALKSVMEAAVDDRIFDRFPIGYKAFFKHGAFSALFHRWAELFKIPAEKKVSERPREVMRRFREFWRWEDFRRMDDSSRRESFRRFYNDAVDLWAAAATPTDLNFFSTGLCEPFPFVEDLVSFEKLKTFRGGFYMNTYCISTGTMEQFKKDQIDAQHFKAALAFPFIYPPTEIDGKLYFEGSATDPLNLPQLEKILGGGEHTVVLIDVLGALKDCLIRKPRNIVDAYGISILTPIVSLAEKIKDEYMEDRQELKQRLVEKVTAKLPMGHGINETELQKEIGKRLFKLTSITFNIRSEDKPFVSDWSYSNMQRLWDIGYAAGQKFSEEKGGLLPDREESGPNPK